LTSFELLSIGVPFSTAIIVLIVQYKQLSKHKEQEAVNAKWLTFEMQLKDLERSQGKFEMEVKGHYLPRVEFMDFMDKLDKRFKEMDERNEKSRQAIEHTIVLTIKSSINELKADMLERSVKNERDH